MRILIIEDSRRLRQSLEAGIKRSGYAVDVAGDGVTGYELARSDSYDVIVLDLMLPGMSGLEILGALRKSTSESCVLILTARDAVEQRVEGLRAGADDYLVKPFSFDELIARIQALTRRRHGKKSPQLRIGSIEINTAGRTVFRDGNAIVLTAREYALLEYLAIRRGQVITRAEIEERIYDGRTELTSNAVDSAVCALRKKIDKGSDVERSMIQTRRGLGYVLDAELPE